MNKGKKKTPLPGWYKGEKKDCDRCGFTFPKRELTKQGGYDLCEKCLDEDFEEGKK